MVLGIEHSHEDQDILAISGWEALLDGLGYSTEDLQESIKPRKILDVNEHCIERIRRLRIAYELISKPTEISVATGFVHCFILFLLPCFNTLLSTSTYDVATNTNL